MSPVAKYWDGSAWTSLNGLPVYEQPGQPSEPVPSGSVWVDTDAPAPAVYPKLLNVQHMEGANAAYTPSLVGPAVVNLTTNAAMTIALQASYTPPVDAWWELDLLLGLVQALSGSYSYVQAQLYLNAGAIPAGGGFAARPAGTVLAEMYRTQHSAVQTFESYHLSKLVPLSAGVLYQVLGRFNISAGTGFSYHQGPETLYLDAKAWSR